MNLSFSKKNYNSGVSILNVFLFITLKQAPIRNKLIQNEYPMKQQNYMQMQKFSVHFPSRSSDLGKSLSITSIKFVLI